MRGRCAKDGKWGGRQQAAGSRQQAAGSRQQAAGSRQQAAGSRQQAAGSRQQAAGSRQQAAGSRQQVAGSRQQAAKHTNEQASGGVKGRGAGCVLPTPTGAPVPGPRKNRALLSMAAITPKEDAGPSAPAPPTAARRDTTAKLPVSCRSACTSSSARHDTTARPPGAGGTAACRAALWRRHAPTKVVGGRVSCSGGTGGGGSGGGGSAGSGTHTDRKEVGHGCRGTRRGSPGPNPPHPAFRRERRTALGRAGTHATHLQHVNEGVGPVQELELSAQLHVLAKQHRHLAGGLVLQLEQDLLTVGCEWRGAHTQDHGTHKQPDTAPQHGTEVRHATAVRHCKREGAATRQGENGKAKGRAMHTGAQHRDGSREGKRQHAPTREAGDRGRASAQADTRTHTHTHTHTHMASIEDEAHHHRAGSARPGPRLHLHKKNPIARTSAHPHLQLLVDGLLHSHGVGLHLLHASVQGGDGLHDGPLPILHCRVLPLGCRQRGLVLLRCWRKTGAWECVRVCVWGG